MAHEYDSESFDFVAGRAGQSAGPFPNSFVGVAFNEAPPISVWEIGWKGLKRLGEASER
jgi:hypothetical protein